MNPGETILGFDFQNHLFIVISVVAADGRVAIVNLTSHGQPQCSDACVVIVPSEHRYVRKDSCVYYRKAEMLNAQPLIDAKHRHQLSQHDPCSPDLLRRIQDGALSSRFTADIVKAAVRTTLAGS